MSLDTVAFSDPHACINNQYLQNSGIIVICANMIKLFQIHWQALGCVFLVARCNITRTSWESKKKRLSYRKMYIEEFEWGKSLFWLHTLLLMSYFVVFFVYSLPFVYSEFTQKKKFCSRKWWLVPTALLLKKREIFMILYILCFYSASYILK